MAQESKTEPVISSAEHTIASDVAHRRVDAVFAYSSVSHTFGTIEGKMPFRVPEDLKRFQGLTAGALVIMGAKTYLDMAPIAHKLDRRPVVVTRRWEEGLSRIMPKPLPPRAPILVRSLAEALTHETGRRAVVVGGARLLGELLSYHASIGLVHVCVIPEEEVTAEPKSRIPAKELVDALMALHLLCESASEETGVVYRTYGRSHELVREMPPLVEAVGCGRHGEAGYLSLIRDILVYGKRKGDRTGTGTLMLPCQSLTFDLTENKWPLLTTKKTFHRVLTEELLWFLRGETDVAKLRDKRVFIWDGDTNETTLRGRGFETRPEWEAGPIYGWQWRNFGAGYIEPRGLIPAHHAQDGTLIPAARPEGVDQIEALRKGLRENPLSRRHVLTAWNPAQLPQMALPPCHLMAIWTVSEGITGVEGTGLFLHCQLVMRSADLCLGVPFNIASYSLLTRLLAQDVGMTAASLTVTMADCHIYSNHVGGAVTMLGRVPHAPPTMDCSGISLDELDKAEAKSVVVSDYKPHGTVVFPLNT